jgi:hypothetical protein
MKRIATVGLTLGLLAGGVGTAGASTITWTGGALVGTGTSQISTAGTFVEAHNVGDATALAAGGITFDAAAASPFANIFGDFLFIPLTGDAAFDAVLDSGSWESGPKVLTLTGLTVGRSYLTQLFVADTRYFCCGDRTVTVTAGNSATSGALLSGWVFNGTFTADAITQAITFTGAPDGYAYLNASQLRDITATGRDLNAVPEPATLVLCSIGAMLAASRLRRRQ